MNNINVTDELKKEQENINKLKDYVSWLESELDFRDKQIENLESKIFRYEDNPMGYSDQERYCY